MDSPSKAGGFDTSFIDMSFIDLSKASPGNSTSLNGIDASVDVTISSIDATVTFIGATFDASSSAVAAAAATGVLCQGNRNLGCVCCAVSVTASSCSNNSNGIRPPKHLPPLPPPLPAPHPPPQRLGKQLSTAFKTGEKMTRSKGTGITFFPYFLPEIVFFFTHGVFLFRLVMVSFFYQFILVYFSFFYQLWLFVSV